MKLVFLIDQNAMVRDYLEQYLPSQGFKVYSLNSVEDADYLIKDLKPELLLFDVETVNVPSFLKEMPNYTEDIPLITMGHSQIFSQSVAHFQKPLNPIELKNFLIQNYK